MKLMRIKSINSFSSKKVCGFSSFFLRRRNVFGCQKGFTPSLHVAHLQSINTPGFEPGELPRQHSAAKRSTGNITTVAMKDAMTDAMTDEMTDAMTDAMKDAMTDGMKNAMTDDIFRQFG
jgi:hypothetical protein